MVFEVERVELAILALALQFEAVEDFGSLTFARVFDVPLDHAVVQIARRDGLNFAVKRIVIDIDRVARKFFLLTVFLLFVLVPIRVFLFEQVDHVAEGGNEVRLLPNLLERVDRVARHLAEAKVVRNEGVELAAQSEHFVFVFIAERRTALVVATDTFEEVFDLR